MPVGLTFLLQDLEAFLGLGVQVLQVLRPAALDENILLVVLGGSVVDRQPLLVSVPFRASCWDSGEKKGFGLNGEEDQRN